MANPADLKVTELLIRASVEFKVKIIGATKRDGWECDEWRVLFKGAQIEFSTEYYAGIGHRVDTPITKLARIALKGASKKSIVFKQQVLDQLKPVAPSAGSVLYSLLMDSSAVDQSFIDWCYDFDYETDSRKALATYEACCETGLKMRKLFTPDQRKLLSELLQDY